MAAYRSKLQYITARFSLRGCKFKKPWDREAAVATAENTACYEPVIGLLTIGYIGPPKPETPEP